MNLHMDKDALARIKGMLEKNTAWCGADKQTGSI